MGRLGEALGLTWTVVAERVRRVTVDGAQIDVPFRLVYSHQGPPHVELVEEVPGTIWVGAPSALHHVGHWSDDVQADSEKLSENEWPRVAWAASDDPRRWRWAYHAHPAGGYLEVVDTSVRTELEERLRGAAT